MATYCYNLSSHVGDADYNSSKPLVTVKVLHNQAEICLSAINAYSLIDEQLAFFKLQVSGSYAHQRPKRQVDMNDSWLGGGQTKHFRSDASTMGWQVTAAPESNAAGPAQLQERTPSNRTLPDGNGATDTNGDGRRIAAVFSSIVTLAILRQHYSLLR